MAGALLVVFVIARPQFTARTARRAGLRALLLFLVGSLVVSLVGSWLLTCNANADSIGAGDAVANVLLGDLGLVDDPGVVAPMWVRVLLNVMGAAVVLGSAAVLFRSPAYTRRLGAPDEAVVRTMLREHGDLDSLGYFATRRDKAVVWDADDPARARAGVSYRVVRGVSLASGNPIGDPEHWGAAIDAWRRDARANGWSLAVMAAGSEGARAFEEAGLTVFEIGDEAILDLGGFSLTELGRQFRNEGADSSHNPEFTSLEVYGTYNDYVSMRLLTQELIKEAAVAVYGRPIARRPRPDGTIEEFDLSGDWPAIPICTAVSIAPGEEVSTATPLAELQRHARAIGLDLDPGLTWGAVLEEVYGELCEGQTTTPVFYTDFPRDTSPLTRVHRDDPKLVEKWDLVIWGSEQGTAYSELIDPVDQRARLVEQSLLAAGDPEAMEVDEDFLSALEYGMPPTGGMGMGVDRLVMNLTGLGIRDTILFPITKPT